VHGREVNARLRQDEPVGSHTNRLELAAEATTLTRDPVLESVAQLTTDDRLERKLQTIVQELIILDWTRDHMHRRAKTHIHRDLNRFFGMGGTT